MKRRALSVFALTAGLATLACDRKHDVVVTPVPAAARPAAAKPAAVRPATRPVSLISISDQVFTFPPAKLVLQQNNTGVIATLFSDDPPEAIKSDYRGNSFRFEVAFEGVSIDEISGQTFTWKNSAEDKPDSMTGIFLNGQQQSVQPLAATLTLLKVGEQWTANIGGHFQYVDNQAADRVPMTIHAFAEMTAELVQAAAKP